MSFTGQLSKSALRFLCHMAATEHVLDSGPCWAQRNVLPPSADGGESGLQVSNSAHTSLHAEGQTSKWRTQACVCVSLRWIQILWVGVTFNSPLTPFTLFSIFPLRQSFKNSKKKLITLLNDAVLYLSELLLKNSTMTKIHAAYFR